MRLRHLLILLAFAALMLLFCKGCQQRVTSAQAKSTYVYVIISNTPALDYHTQGCVKVRTQIIGMVPLSEVADRYQPCPHCRPPVIRN